MGATNHCSDHGTNAADHLHCYCKAAATKCCDNLACPQNSRKVCCKCGAAQAFIGGYLPGYPRVWPSYPNWGTADEIPLGGATWQIPASSRLGGFTSAAATAALSIK